MHIFHNILRKPENDFHSSKWLLGIGRNALFPGTEKSFQRPWETFCKLVGNKGQRAQYSLPMQYCTYMCIHENGQASGVPTPPPPHGMVW